MDMKDLEYFRVICQEKSIGQAARRLYLSSQGLGRILRNMEAELDTTLLVRTKKGIVLTESGKALLKTAEQIGESWQNLSQEIRNIENRKRGAVDLLSAYGIIRLLTPDCLTAFREAWPDIELGYREYPDCQVERLFLEKEGNVAFSIGPCPEGLYDIMELESFSVKLLVNESHPLSRKKEVTIEDLRGEKLFIESSEFKIYHLICDKCREAGFEPDIVYETSGFSLCHKMVAKNRGLSVTVDFVFDDMRQNGLVMIPFSDGDYRWSAQMLTRKGEYISEEVQIFMKHVKDWMNRIERGEIQR